MVTNLYLESQIMDFVKKVNTLNMPAFTKQEVIAMISLYFISHQHVKAPAIFLTLQKESFCWGKI